MDTITERLETLFKIGTEYVDVYNRLDENKRNGENLVGMEIVKGIPFNDAYYIVMGTTEGKNLRDLDSILCLRKVELGFQYDACKLAIEAMIHLGQTGVE
jgi:hypothetical protein